MIRQVGYVVSDIEKAMEHWSTTLGVGPWFCKPDVGTTEFRYHGKPSRLPKLSIALANSGDLQIELIQQHDDAPSLYLDSLRRAGEGAQHLAYWTEDRIDEWVGKLLAAGYVEGHGGRMGARGRFAYFIHPQLPSGMFEISELSGGKGSTKPARRAPRSPRWRRTSSSPIPVVRERPFMAVQRRPGEAAEGPVRHGQQSSSARHGQLRQVEPSTAAVDRPVASDPKATIGDLDSTTESGRTFSPVQERSAVRTSQAVR